jgi:hypothetical protein
MLEGYVVFAFQEVYEDVSDVPNPFVDHDTVLATVWCSTPEMREIEVIMMKQTHQIGTIITVPMAIETIGGV